MSKVTKIVHHTVGEILQALYPVAAVVFIAMLLHCFWRSLLLCPGVLVGKDFLVVGTMSGQLDYIGHIKT